ncbi:MAG: SdpI family protein [Clostridia bacterium]|nr:SdpI family protein [Clostridia bacterium]
MGFWIFMLLNGLLFPAIMLVMGKLFTKSAPKEINYIFGYRTEMSMKNRDTWEFAHTFIGKLWYRLGWILIPVTVIPMLFVIGGTKGLIGTVGGVVCVADLAVLIAGIFPTERALKKNFDKDGNRKNSIET